MDRSYPYSRRLASRALLRKRIAAVAATGLIGAAAVFMLTWKADVIYPALPLPALGDAAAAGEPARQGVRRIYPYSVVPGGVYGHAELKRVIRTDRVVAAHYASFDADKAHAVVVAEPRAVHVSYRKGDKIYWTAHKVMLSPGETLLSDGSKEMRARCGNRISDLPQYPVEAHRPAMEELDQPVEVDEGEQHALGPDGLPLSASGEDGPALPAGAHYQLGGSNAGGSPGLPMDGTLSAVSGSGAADMAPGTTMGMSGASSSMGSRPRPVSRGVGGAPAPAVPAAVAEPGSGHSGGSSGSPAPSEGGAAPVAQPVGGKGGPSAPQGSGTTAPLPPNEQPATDPQPGSGPTPPAGTGPLPAQALPPTGPSIPPATLEPAPSGTDSRPQPATGVPGPVAQPGSGNSGGSSGSPAPSEGGPTPRPQPVGGKDAHSAPPAPDTMAPSPPTTQPSADPQPGFDPAPPSGAGPLPATTPFVPPITLDPAPPETGTGQAPPVEVPEPGSLWLFGLALAAMGLLRRRS